MWYDDMLANTVADMVDDENTGSIPTEVALPELRYTGRPDPATGAMWFNVKDLPAEMISANRAPVATPLSEYLRDPVRWLADGELARICCRADFGEWGEWKTSRLSPQRGVASACSQFLGSRVACGSVARSGG